MTTTSNVKIEPKEVFFYLDKLIRKIKIRNLNEHPIKFELLTLLNENDLSPLQSNETQSIIEPKRTFTVSLEYKDNKEKNTDSIIILSIYNVINEELIECEPIHVPFHFRSMNLVNAADDVAKKNANALTNPDDLLDDLSDESDKSERLDTLIKDQSSTKIKKKSLFKKPKIENIFKSNKTNETAKEKNDQSKNLLTKDPKDKKSKERNAQPIKTINKEETTYNDDLSIYDFNAINSLRFEEERVRKFARLIFLLTFFNFCYTIFLTFFNPLRSSYNEYINNFNLNSISQNCTSWPGFKLFRNFTNKDD